MDVYQDIKTAIEESHMLSGFDLLQLGNLLDKTAKLTQILVDLASHCK
jgi:hypothetical protein